MHHYRLLVRGSDGTSVLTGHELLHPQLLVRVLQSTALKRDFSAVVVELNQVSEDLVRRQVVLNERPLCSKHQLLALVKKSAPHTQQLLLGHHEVPMLDALDRSWSHAHRALIIFAPLPLVSRQTVERVLHPFYRVVRRCSSLQAVHGERLLDPVKLEHTGQHGRVSGDGRADLVVVVEGFVSHF